MRAHKGCHVCASVCVRVMYYVRQRCLCTNDVVSVCINDAPRKHQRITVQHVAINCWLGPAEWRGLV